MTMRIKLILLWALLLIVTLATASDSQDPFVTRSKNLQIAYHNVLEVPDPVYEVNGEKTLFGYTDGVHYLPVELDDPKYLAFLAKMKKFKTELEDESMRRAAKPLGSPGLNALTQVSAEYLDMQAKLYANFAKIVHGFHPKTSSAYYFSDLDQLNLVVNKKVGLPFMTNEKMKRQFNIRHKSPAMVELFVTEEDKHTAEYISLTSPRDPLAYAKLIQFATIRETMVNRWALRRLQAMPSLDVAANSCGKDLLSFKFAEHVSGSFSSQFAAHPLYETPAYAQLSALDNYNAFQKLSKELQTASLNQPIANSVFYFELVKKTFQAFPQFIDEIVPTVNDTAKVDSILQEVVPNMVNIEETSWAKAAQEAILDSSFPADDFSMDSVSDRIATIAFDLRKIYLTQTLMQGLKDKGIQTAQNEKSRDYRQTFKTVSHVVNTQTQPLRDAWMKTQKASLNKVLQSADSLWNKGLIANERLEQVLSAIEANAKQAFRADYLHKIIVVTQKDISQDYQKFLSSKAKTTLPYTFVPFTPELLKKYSYKMLEEFEGMGKKTAEYVFAHQLISNRPVMAAIENFFGKLEEDFKTQTAQITALTPDNSPLGTLLQKSAAKAFVELKQAIRTPAPQVHPETNQDDYNPTAIDALNHPIVMYPDKGQSHYIATEGKRTLAEGQFLSAMNSIGVNLLNTKPVNLDLIAPTVRSQKILSAILVAEAFVKAPLLRLESKLRDGKFYTIDDANAPVTNIELADWSGAKKINPEDNYALAHLAPAYHLSSDSIDHAKALPILQKIIEVAILNNKGKLEDFCAANPKDPDHNVKFQKLFRSAAGLREIFTQNPDIASMDAAMKVATRTETQKILEDYVNPIGTVAMLVILCIICAQFGPIIWGAIVGNAAIAGAGSAVASSVIAQIFIGNFGPVTAMFFVQTLMMVNVNLFQLPPQLAYSLQVANSQIGMGSKLTISREDLAHQQEELASAQNWTWFAIAGDALQIGFTVQEARHALGLIGAKSLAHLSGTPVKGFGSERSFADLVKEKGLGKAVVDLTPKVQHVTVTGLEALLDSKLAKVLGDDPETLQNAYKLALDQDRATLTRLQGLEEALQTEAERIRMTSTSLTPTLDAVYKSFIARLRMLAPPRGGFGLWKVAIWKNALLAIRAGKLPLYWEKMPELALFIKTSQIEEVTARIKYFEGMGAKLDESRKLFADETHTDASQMKLLEFHFSRLSNDDVFMHEKLFKQLKKMAPSVVWTAALDAFKDFTTVKTDIRNIDTGIALEKEFEESRQADVIVAEDGTVTTDQKISDSQVDDYETEIIDPGKLIHP